MERELKVAACSRLTSVRYQPARLSMLRLSLWKSCVNPRRIRLRQRSRFTACFSHGEKETKHQEAHPNFLKAPGSAAPLLPGMPPGTNASLDRLRGVPQAALRASTSRL